MAQTVEERGKSYFLSYETTHKVALPLSDMTCTLVLRGPRARGYSNVYNTTYPATDTTVSNVMFKGIEVLNRLTHLHGAIKAALLPFRVGHGALEPQAGTSTA